MLAKLAKQIFDQNVKKKKKSAILCTVVPRNNVVHLLWSQCFATSTVHCILCPDWL